MGALTDGLSVTSGVVAQNAIARYVPNVIPATVPQAGLINSVAKDVLGILVGSWGAHQLLGADRARFVVAGQAHAAIARGIRAANIPQVSTLMGEYDPIRLGRACAWAPTDGLNRPRPCGQRRQAGNVRALNNVGVYTTGSISRRHSIDGRRRPLTRAPPSRPKKRGANSEGQQCCEVSRRRSPAGR
jgi:hypothetical protein